MAGQGSDQVEFELLIDADEFEKAHEIAFLADPDERDPKGMMTLASDGSVRTWGSTTSVMLTVVETGSDNRVYRHAISPRLVYSWQQAAGGSGEALLRLIEDDGERFWEMSGPGGYARVAWVPVEPLDLVGVIERYRENEDNEAWVVIDTSDLGELLLIARTPPYPLGKDDPVPPMSFRVVEGGLRAVTNWSESGPTEYFVPVAASGTAVIDLSPHLLLELLKVHRGDLRIVLSRAAVTTVRIEGDGLTSLLMGIGPGSGAVIRVEECIESVFGRESLQTDSDGDYELSLFGVPVYARLLDGEPAVLRVFAVVLRDTPQSDELLAELNEINMGSPFARVVVNDGTVIAMGELVADTMDGVELKTLYDYVSELASDIGPALSARFGGTEELRGEWYRWSNYVSTTILAEVRPHRWVELAGPNATDEWDLPDEVFVVTAYNPFGRVRDRDENVAALAELAGELISIGGTAARVVASSTDGDHKEPSLLTWGLEEQVVLDLARRFRQEAIFRLTSESIEVVGTLIDYRISRPRRAEPDSEE